MISAATVEVSFDSILKKVSQEQIMVYYLGLPLDLNRVFSSPFRDDLNPSCAFYYGKTGRLYLHDFAKGEFMSCMDVVMKKLKCSYYKALNHVNSNVEKISYFNPQVIEKEAIEYTWTTAKFQDEYFKLHDISRATLTKFDVVLAGEVFKNGESNISSTKDDPAYIYRINGRCKVYRPLTKFKKNKFRSSALFSDVFGMKQLPKNSVLCIITSSVKDMMVLHEHGFPALCFNSEALPQRGENLEVMEAVLDALKSRFRFVVSLFDSDETGKKNAMMLYGKYDIPAMFISKEKDPADFQKRFKSVLTSRALKKLISRTFKQ